MNGKERDRYIATEMAKEHRRLAQYEKRLGVYKDMLRNKRETPKKRDAARLHVDYLEKHMDTVREDMRQR